MKYRTKQYETPLTKKMVKYLNSLDNCFVYKRQAGAFRKGMADISGVINGIRIEIEVKVGNNKPSALQLVWLNRCYQHGCLVACVWSMEELKWIMEHYKEYIKNNRIYLPYLSNWKIIIE